MTAPYAASPHRFATPVVQESPRRESMPALLVFPECAEGESFAEYQHAARPTMREWVQAILDRVSVDSPHDLWVLTTDLATKDMQRTLRDHEGVLLTRVVKEMYDAHEAIRMHSPRKLFR